MGVSISLAFISMAEPANLNVNPEICWADGVQPRSSDEGG
jgi:hypothetical protein